MKPGRLYNADILDEIMKKKKHKKRANFKIRDTVKALLEEAAKGSTVAQKELITQSEKSASFKKTVEALTAKGGGFTHISYDLKGPHFPYKN
ncbi:MAG: hypothetical protein ACKVIX_05810 [Sphingomonadales bacterium]